MKKTFIALFTLAASCAVETTWAQGYIDFFSTASTAVSTNAVAGGPATGPVSANAGTTGTTYYFALFVSSTAPSSTAPIAGIANGQTYAFQSGSGWTFDNPTTTAGYIGPAYGTNIATAGQFNSTVENLDRFSQTLLASSSAQYFVVVGWSANLGSTLPDLETWYANPTSSGLVGQSQASGLLTPSNSDGPPAALFGTGTG